MERDRLEVRGTYESWRQVRKGAVSRSRRNRVSPCNGQVKSKVVEEEP